MEKFCLKWNDFQVNASKSFGLLKQDQDFFDVTLISDDDKSVAAHKVVLAASSDVFKHILRKAVVSETPCRAHGSPELQLWLRLRLRPGKEPAQNEARSEK